MVAALHVGAYVRFFLYGSIDLGPAKWVGATLLIGGIVSYIAWFMMTARRLRSAGISRAWMVPAFLSINLPIGGVTINFSLIAALVLAAVAAMANDRAVMTN